MKKLKVVVAVVLLVLVAVVAYARTDYMCMQDCLAKGYLYSYCQRVCSY